MSESKQKAQEQSPISNQPKLPFWRRHKLLTIIIGAILIALVVAGYFWLKHENNIRKQSQQKNFNNTVQQNSSLFAQGKYSQALAQLKDQAAQPANNSQKYIVLIQTGAIYIQQKQYNKALQEYVNAYNLEPQSADASTLLTIGGLYKTTGNKSKAIEFYKKAISALKTDPNNLYNRYIPEYQKAIVQLEGS